MIRRAMAQWEATNENIYFFEVCIGMSMGMGIGMGIGMGTGMGTGMGMGTGSSVLCQLAITPYMSVCDVHMRACVRACAHLGTRNRRALLQREDVFNDGLVRALARDVVSDLDDWVLVGLGEDPRPAGALDVEREDAERCNRHELAWVVFGYG